MTNSNAPFILALFVIVLVGNAWYNHVPEKRPDDQPEVTVELPPEHEIVCLAKNVYFESRNQSEAGMEAVAWVTLNRVESDKYPNTICDVVWQSGQFSWTEDGKSDKPKNKRAWEKSIRAAIAVLYFHGMKQYEFDPTEGSIMYHATMVEPYWADAYELVMVEGDHIFYK